MLRDVLHHLDYSAWAEVSLTIFLLTFIAVVIRTLRSNRESAHRHAAMALDDVPEEVGK